MLTENIKYPLISVIMNCLNCEQYLQEAIDSVYSQTYSNWEIIFWDNASTDKSAEIAKKYDARLNYYCSEKTIPLGAARNKAIEMAKGEFIAFLDCDDLWLPKKLEKQIPLFEDPNVGIVISNAQYFNKNGVVRNLYNKFSKIPKGYAFKQLLTNSNISMPTVIVRYRCFHNLDHWFDPEFNIIEELDLILRIVISWKIANANFILAKYRIHENNTTSKNLNQLYSERDQLIKKLCNETKSLLLYGDYKREFEKFIMKTEIGKAAFLYTKNGEQHARNSIKPYIFKDLRALVFYLTTFSVIQKLLIYLFPEKYLERFTILKHIRLS